MTTSVVVSDASHCYTRSIRFAGMFKLTDWDNGSQPHAGHAYKLLAIHPHPDNHWKTSTIAVIQTSKGKQYLIDQRGIKLIGGTPVTKTYKITADFLHLKAGDSVTSEKETEQFISLTVDGNELLVPKVLLEDDVPKAPKKPLKVGMTISAEEVEELGTLLANAPTEFKDEGDDKRVEEASDDNAIQVVAIDLKPNEFFLSTVTNGRLPDSGIDHIMCAFPEEHWDEDAREDIPEVDPTYYWDANLLEAMWVSHKLNKKMLLTGYPGTGKTTAVRQFGAWIRQPVMRFNGKDGIEQSSFLGNIWANSGAMEWRDGMLPIGVRQGYLVTIDEVFKIPAGIQMAMQNLYEENGYLTLDDNPDMSEKNVYPHDNFRMYLTDNVKGTGDDFDKFSATQVQDSSTLDRFGITATVQYLPHRDEVKMLESKYSSVPIETIKKLVRFAGLIRESYAKGGVSLTISPRGLQTMCEVLSMSISPEQAVKMVYMDKIGDPDELDTANEAYRACF